MRPHFRLVRLAPAWFARLAPGALGLGLGVLALGPALGPGFTLRYDMVFVPDPPLRLDVAGFPRAVPSDQVVALLSEALPAEVVQKLILLGIFVLAASGAAALVPSGRTAPRLAAAAFYAWNAYLAQRLLLGQWALLLGFAGLPWAVRAASRGGAWRLAPALLPAAVGGFQAMLVSALTVLPVAALRTVEGPVEGWWAPARRSEWTFRGRAVLTSAAVIVVLSLPWLVPALRTNAVTDPAGVAAFAPRADGPFGTLGSLLSLGGIWNSHADVPGQDSWALASVRLALTAIALAGFVLLVHGTRVRRAAGGHAGEPGAGGGSGGVGGSGGLRGSAGGSSGPLVRSSGQANRFPSPVIAQMAVQGRGSGGGSEGDGYGLGLAVAAGVGLLIACAGAFVPGVPRAMIGWWPGFGPFRDGQLYVAPLALAEAVGFAVVVSALGRRGPVATAVPVLVATAVPVLVLPTFALGAFGRLGSADYPDEWRRVQAIVNDDPHPGALVSLPWGAYRAFPWNGGRVVLDPATKLFARRVIWDDTLVVGVPGRGRIRVAAEDPLTRRIAALISGGAGAGGGVPVGAPAEVDGGGGGRGGREGGVPAGAGAGEAGAGGGVPAGARTGAAEAGGTGTERAGSLTGDLAREGVRYVLVEGSNENQFLFRLRGATPVWRGESLLLLRI
ncbi:hypothetical protein N5079_01565 [Planotetraspora sp. A-T 1434]|uniref:hypothetical protein n=1 Tax=Planotetraspora sp. A-T 1434 TaxID=2979219 RepID=UPI0021C2412A|nr:hypothetical protein [Planotetraspora sp. A-T 1434]MCT9928900.1 hypothetical protein [Planotetraspora sp. A-T 1434]